MGNIPGREGILRRFEQSAPIVILEGASFTRGTPRENVAENKVQSPAEGTPLTNETAANLESVAQQQEAPGPESAKASGVECAITVSQTTAVSQQHTVECAPAKVQLPSFTGKRGRTFPEINSLSTDRLTYLLYPCVVGTVNAITITMGCARRLESPQYLNDSLVDLGIRYKMDSISSSSLHHVVPGDGEPGGEYVTVNESITHVASG